MLAALVGPAAAAQLVTDPAERNGYALGFPGRGTLASTRRLFLDPSNAEIARLRHGFTLTSWVKFMKSDPVHFAAPVSVVWTDDTTGFTAFGGAHGGWRWGGRSPSLMADIQLQSWHWLAESWDEHTGEVRFHLDGSRWEPPEPLFVGKGNGAMGSGETALFLGGVSRTRPTPTTGCLGPLPPSTAQSTRLSLLCSGASCRRRRRRRTTL